MEKTPPGLIELYKDLPEDSKIASPDLALIASTDPKTLASACSETISTGGSVAIPKELVLANRINSLQQKLSRPARWLATAACAITLAGSGYAVFEEIKDDYAQTTEMHAPKQDNGETTHGFAIIGALAGALGGAALGLNLSERFLDGRAARYRARLIINKTTKK